MIHYFFKTWTAQRMHKIRKSAEVFKKNPQEKKIPKHIHMYRPIFFRSTRKRRAHMLVDRWNDVKKFFQLNQVSKASRLKN